MPRKIYPQTKKAMRRWREQGMSLREIAGKAHVSYSTACMYASTSNEQPSPRTAYQERWAQEKGFENYQAYLRTLEQKVKSSPEAQELSALVRDQLALRGKSQGWLADQVGVTRETISNYTNMHSFPKPQVLERIYRALDVQYATLEEKVR